MNIPSSSLSDPQRELLYGPPHGTMRRFTLVLLLTAGCASEPSPESAVDRTAAIESTQPDTLTAVHEAQGVVRNITPSRSHFVIEHGVIEGFMQPMTMPFALHPDSAFDHVEVGDSVAFTIEIRGRTTVLVRVDTLGAPRE